MKIIYLGNSRDYDEYTARLLWNWLKDNTGHRGLVVVHPRAKS